MRKSGTLHIILEIVTILINIIIGVSVLTFIAYQHQENLDLNKSFIGSVVLAIGVTEMVEFLSLKTLAKYRNIPNAVVAGLSMITGIIHELTRNLGRLFSGADAFSWATTLA